MSATNFLNNFTNGFMFGMLNNSNPFFGANTCCNQFNFNSCFSTQPLFLTACNSYSPYTNPWTTPFPNKTEYYMVPNTMMNFTQLMPEITPPAFNYNLSNSFNNFSFDFNSITPQQTTGDYNFFDSFKFNFENLGKTNNLQLDKNSSNKTQSSGSNEENITYDAKELKEKWNSKKSGLSDAFYEKVVDISKKIKCSPNDLMAVMYSESKLDTKAVNKDTNATGLIQFIPDTAKSLGTSVNALKKMSAEEQLTYVEKFLVTNKKSAGYSSNTALDAGSLYALVFLPSRAKFSTLSTKNDKYYAKNKGLDANNDGKITKDELNTRVKSYYA